MQRRTWSTDEKLAIVMAGLKKIQSVAELCREHQISQTQYYKWRDQFLEGGKQALMGAKHDTTKQFERKVEQLERIIGKQTVALEVLKKLSTKRASLCRTGSGGRHVAHRGWALGHSRLPVPRRQPQSLLCRKDSQEACAEPRTPP